MASLAFTLPASPVEQIACIRAGLPGREAKQLLTAFDIPLGQLLAALAIPVATFNRKVAKGEPLAPDESERVLGLAAMANQVQRIVNEAGARRVSMPRPGFRTGCSAMCQPWAGSAH